jgi:isopentenyl-diphosphate delta-isomerase
MIPAIAEDGSLYPVEKLDAHRRGLLHMAISVFVFCDGKLLLQQRALEKYHSPGLWANTCCSHPHWNEDPATAANRRMQEELGYVCPLEPVGITEYRADVGGGLIEHERVHVFAATLLTRPTLAPNPSEVATTHWLSMADLAKAIADKPESYAQWLKLYIARKTSPPLEFLAIR